MRSKEPQTTTLRLLNSEYPLAPDPLELTRQRLRKPGILLANLTDPRTHLHSTQTHSALPIRLLPTQAPSSLTKTFSTTRTLASSAPWPRNGRRYTRSRRSHERLFSHSLVRAQQSDILVANGFLWHMPGILQEKPRTACTARGSKAVLTSPHCFCEAALFECKAFLPPESSCVDHVRRHARRSRAGQRPVPRLLHLGQSERAAPDLRDCDPAS